MKSIVKHIPNFLTSMNLLSGCIAIVFAFESTDMLVYASLMIAIGSIFDFADGFAARALKAYSAIGKELDSLGDMISFGLAPAVIAFRILQMSLSGSTGIVEFSSLEFDSQLLCVSAFIIAIFSALRLAKFNLDTRQTEQFIGLATPANAYFFASMPVILYFEPSSQIAELILQPIFIVAAILVFSFLLNAEIPMFSFKVKTLKFKTNIVRYLFLICIVILIAVFGWIGLFFVIPCYIVLSLINNRFIHSTLSHKL